jgi:LacI family transcriptional regulator
MRTTLKDIAERTGLSVTTVSLVLNNRPCRVAEETRSLIRKAAKDMNYRPNMVAVSLVMGKTNTIGLIVSDIRNSFFSTLAKGVEDESSRHNWNVVLCNTNDLHQKDMDYIRILADKGVNGIIWGMASETTPEMAEQCMNLMDEGNIPYLLVDRYIDTKRGCIVCVNHEMGGYLATQHLIGLGHRQIACATGPLNLIDSRLRLAGYCKALREAGIPYDKTLVVEENYTFQGGVDAIERLAARGAAYTGMFAFNDMMAFGCMRALRNAHRKIPQDVSLVGYDNVFYSDLLDVPLTTVEQPVYEMGAESARQIIRRNAGMASEPQLVFDPKLIVREMTRRL